MTKQLFQVELHVHFSAEHPKAAEFEFGILQVWLFAETPPAAIETAVRMVRLLPYKILGAKSFPYAEDETVLPFQKVCADRAKTMAVNFALHHYPKGTNEKEVLGNWPLLVPFLNLNGQ
jgi:hypothetical protein